MNSIETTEGFEGRVALAYHSCELNSSDFAPKRNLY